LRIVTSVNGETRQDDTVASMVFDVPTVIAYLSQITTLFAGDLIFTGTPAGIGAAHGTFLADGDVITTTIDRVGTLVNRCVRVSDHTSPGDRIGAAS
jgi:2-keto-4-pentenoate hydratase/2-oxohepta-3-ene-1,7-dioic acid hydratase in catechol pathway